MGCFASQDIDRGFASASFFPSSILLKYIEYLYIYTLCIYKYSEKEIELPTWRELSFCCVDASMGTKGLKIDLQLWLFLPFLGW